MIAMTIKRLTIIVIFLIANTSAADSELLKSCVVVSAHKINSSQNVPTWSFQIDDSLAGCAGPLFIKEESSFLSKTINVGTAFTCGGQLDWWHCEERKLKSGGTFFSCDSDDEGKNPFLTGSLVYNQELDYGYIYSVEWVPKAPLEEFDIKELLGLKSSQPTKHKETAKNVLPERQTKVIEFNCTESY